MMVRPTRWVSIYKNFSEAFNWTPEEISRCTMAQLYYYMKATSGKTPVTSEADFKAMFKKKNK